jgi:eukaryotic-like serine/threonine-protein kinase
VVSLLRFREPGGAATSVAWNFGMGAPLYLYPALLAVTARRRNGFATITDLLTKTRVIQKSAYEPREMVAQIEEPIATTDEMPKVGPYHVLAPLGADGHGELFLGYDTKLMRRVWIRKTPADAAHVAAQLRNAARPGRLRWLQGHRNGSGSWDAYEAAPGTPLTSLLRRPQPWKNVRHWLLDLSTEFAATARDGSMPATLSLDRVWITASGGAKLLDFPAPGAEPGTGAGPAPNDNGGENVPLLEPAAFLNQVAVSALEGRVASAEEARNTAPRVPVPIRARGL